MYLAQLIIIGLICSEAQSKTTGDEVFHIALDTDGKITLDWLIDYGNDEVWLEMHVPRLDFGWFAFGFSERGNMYPADYCLLWIDYKQKLHLEDTWADGDGVLHMDEKQDCKQFMAKFAPMNIKYVFSRKFDTCDEDDYIIEDGTTHIVWSKGNEILHHADGVNISTTAEHHGMQRTQLLKNTHVSSKEDVGPHVITFDVTANEASIPNLETTYWCRVMKLPETFREKHHIVKYEPVIMKENEGVVHHLEVFHCIAPDNEEIPLYEGDCFAPERPHKTLVCKRVIAAWAMGSKGFTYPDEAALPIGGPNFNRYVMLELHYNNPLLKAGMVDSSGIRFHITDQLRRYDAGVMELGLEYTDKMAIPTQEEYFPLSGYCVSECTAVSLPPDGINVFGSQLHTHLTGVEVITRHVRDGIELKALNWDKHYSPHFQEIRRLKRSVKVLPGDALITTCHYNTMDRSNVTLGGFAISDEMCVNYIHYYPATPLEVCKSAISDQSLRTYFQYMHEWEGQKTNATMGISDNYRAIEWNRMRSQLLNDIYKEAPLSAQCNMSSGDRFPGYWENTPITYVSKPLPPPVRKCLN